MTIARTSIRNFAIAQLCRTALTANLMRQGSIAHHSDGTKDSGVLCEEKPPESCMVPLADAGSNDMAVVIKHRHTAVAVAAVHRAQRLPQNIADTITQ